jgi:DNA-binding transcriptional LysR family regulator
MLPALALQQDVPDGVAVVALAGLGSRRMVARHRKNRHEPGPAVRAVVDEMVAAAREIDLG